MKFLAVAEAGKIGAAAERLAIAQPALTRTIARLEARFGARLFERLPTGVRLTPLGETAVELARGLLREIDAAAEKFDAVIRGRTGSYRITASSMWMEAVLAPAVDAFSARLPGIELTLRTAPFGDGLQLLANGDLHCARRPRHGRHGHGCCPASRGRGSPSARAWSVSGAAGCSPTASCRRSSQRTPPLPAPCRRARCLPSCAANTSSTLPSASSPARIIRCWPARQPPPTSPTVPGSTTTRRSPRRLSRWLLFGVAV